MAFLFIGATVVIYFGVGKYVVAQTTAHLK